MSKYLQLANASENLNLINTYLERKSGYNLLKSQGLDEQKIKKTEDFLLSARNYLISSICDGIPNSLELMSFTIPQNQLGRSYEIASQYRQSKTLTISYAIAANDELNFLLENEEIKSQLLTQEELKRAVLNAHPTNLKNWTFIYNQNTALNLAITNKNEAWIKAFLPSILKRAATDKTIKDQVYIGAKIALNESNTLYCKIYEEHFPGEISKMKTINGYPVTYCCTSFEGLDFLQSIGIEENKPHIWIEKNIFNFLDTIKQVSAYSKAERDRYDTIFVNLIKEAKKRGIDIEYYKKKKPPLADKNVNSPLPAHATPASAPPLWIAISRNLHLLSQLEPMLDESKKDSNGSNFLYYLVNTMRRQAPNTSSGESEMYLGPIFKSKKYDVNEKNNVGQNVIDLLISVTYKNTFEKSKKLDDFKSYCQKLALDQSLNLQQTTTGLDISAKMRHKI